MLSWSRLCKKCKKVFGVENASDQRACPHCEEFYYKTSKVTVEVLGTQVTFNETVKHNKNGDEIYERNLEQMNDIKCFEEYEMITGKRILKDRDYDFLNRERN